MKEMKFTWKSWVWLIVLVGGFIFLQKRNEHKITDDKLAKAANEMNRNCPMQVDSTTRLDNVVALPDNRVQYNYTFNNGSSKNMDTAAFKVDMQNDIVKQIKTDKKHAFFKENNTTLLFSYRNEAGQYLFNIIISPEKYNK